MNPHLKPRLLLVLALLAPSSAWAGPTQTESGWWAILITIMSSLIAVAVTYGALRGRVGEHGRRLDEHNRKLEQMDYEIEGKVGRLYDRLEEVQRQVMEVPHRTAELLTHLVRARGGS